MLAPKATAEKQARFEVVWSDSPTTASGSAGMEDDGWDGNCIALMVNAATIRVYSTAGGSLTDASAICVTGFGD